MFALSPIPTSASLHPLSIFRSAETPPASLSSVSSFWWVCSGCWASLDMLSIPGAIFICFFRIWSFARIRKSPLFLYSRYQKCPFDWHRFMQLSVTILTAFFLTWTSLSWVATFISNRWILPFRFPTHWASCSTRLWPTQSSCSPAAVRSCFSRYPNCSVNLLVHLKSPIQKTVQTFQKNH